MVTGAKEKLNRRKPLINANRGGLKTVTLAIHHSSNTELTQMKKKTRILFLSANPWTTSRILVDEEAREIFEKLQEGSCRDHFEFQKHSALRPTDLQRLLMMYEPHIVHFSGHGSKRHQLILGSAPGRAKEVDRQGLADVLGLYKNHLRLVFLNACFTEAQALSLCCVIDYSIGTGKGIGDKSGVAFAAAFYRALGFGKSVKEAFESAKAEVGLTKMPRTRGIQLFAREGVNRSDPFPRSRRILRKVISTKRFHRASSKETRSTRPLRAATSLSKQEPLNLKRVAVKDQNHVGEQSLVRARAPRQDSLVRGQILVDAVMTASTPLFVRLSIDHQEGVSAGNGHDLRCGEKVTESPVRAARHHAEFSAAIALRVDVHQVLERD